MTRTGALVSALALLLAVLLADSTASAGQPATGRSIGDTLTVIMRPILSVPEITVPGGGLTIEAMASALDTAGWKTPA